VKRGNKMTTQVTPLTKGVNVEQLGGTMNASVEGVRLDVAQLRAAIRTEYEVVATRPQQGFHFHTGRPLTRMLGYAEHWLAGVPEQSIESFAGTGNPFAMGLLRPGEHVVDVACGAGIDSLIAGRMVAPDGMVVGVDMTPAMLAKARGSAAFAKLTNVEFREGYSEALPVPDAWADVVISNGALNLMPDKLKTLQEMARVLKPDGRLQIADIVVQKAVPKSAVCNIELWTGCIAGALLEPELRSTVVHAGFVDFEITWSADVFGGAPQASSAASFGTLGINFRARKPNSKQEWMAALEALPPLASDEPQPQPLFAADYFYDAGDAGCAFGPIDEIARLLLGMGSGQTLEVRATDPSVAVDLPAWSRLSGNQLVKNEGDRYLLRRK
jgi:SAM-dependent methyltransferase/TusA-related sulfurtransferase